MTCMFCGEGLPVTSPSEDFCSYDHQQSWHARYIEPLVDPDSITLWSISERTRKDETPDPLMVGSQDMSPGVWVLRVNQESE